MPFLALYIACDRGIVQYQLSEPLPDSLDASVCSALILDYPVFWEKKKRKEKLLLRDLAETPLGTLSDEMNRTKFCQKYENRSAKKSTIERCAAKASVLTS